MFGCFSYDIYVDHFWYVLFCPGVFHHSSVAGVCPVTMDLIDYARQCENINNSADLRPYHLNIRRRLLLTVVQIEIEAGAGGGARQRNVTKATQGTRE